MKKILSALIALLLVALCGLSVFAAGDAVTAVSLDGTVPVAGMTPSQMTLSEFRVYAQIAGFSRYLSEMNGEYSYVELWEKKSGADSFVALGASDAFIAGESYRRTVTVTVLRDITVPTTVPATFHTKTATCTVQEKVITVSFEYVALEADLSPVVTLKNSAKALERSYDGKTDTLSVEFEKKTGLNYRIEWYRDNTLLPEETGDTVKIRNVKDSGTYFCRVIASPALAAASAKQEYATDSQKVAFTIFPVELTVLLDDVQKNLFERDPEFTYEIIGDYYDELIGEPAREEGEDVGTYEIYVGTLGFDPSVADNYYIYEGSAVFEILPIGELPFSAVTVFADDSRVVGKDGATVRIQATKGAIPAGALLTLTRTSDDDRSSLRTLAREDLITALTVSLIDPDDIELDFASHARFRLQIPLTEEVAKQQNAYTIGAHFYNGVSYELLPTKVKVVGEVTYIEIEISSAGSVALSVGDLVEVIEPQNPTVPDEPASGEPDEQDERDSTILWIIIGVIGAIALGIVVFTLIWSRKNHTEHEKHDEDEDVAVFFDVEREQEAAPSAEKPEKEKADAKENGGSGRVVSFEDLEE